MEEQNRAAGHKPKNKSDAPTGKNYILAIGIDHYDHHRSLKNAVADAKSFVELMTKRYGFEHLDRPLYDKEATQRNIRKALSKCESLSEHDRLIVFYSGHGWYKKASKLGYLVPTEAEDDPNSDFIPVNFVTDIFRAVDAHHILLVVDCCFGGSFGVERDIVVNEKMTANLITKLDKKKSRMLLSSGGIELVSDGLLAENNSPFTKPLIEILTENQAPEMAFSEFFRLLCKKVAWNAEQTPQYKVLQHLGHDNGELALFCTDLESPEERAFKEAVQTQSIALLANFIRDFPKSEHKTAVVSLLKARRAEEKWERIKNSRDIEDVDGFIDYLINKELSDSPFMELARQKMDALEFIDEEKERVQREKAEKERRDKAEKEAIERRERDRLDKLDADRLEKERLEKIEIERKKQEAEAQKEREHLAQIKQQQEETARKNREKEEKERQKQALIAQLQPEMVLVKGGTFDRKDQKVTLSDFYIGKYPITQKQWQAIMGNNPSNFKGDNLPVESVSWDDCQAFIEKINEKTGKIYRLPTEAEWEFAARGGNKSQGCEYSGSNDLDEVAWYRANSDNKTHPVGTKKANELGIHDMTGNIWEWCNDWYGDYAEAAVTNPQGADSGSYRVFRGGSWAYSAPDCGVARRYCDAPTFRFDFIGFRLVCSLQ